MPQVYIRMHIKNNIYITRQADFKVHMEKRMCKNNQDISEQHQMTRQFKSTVVLKN